MNYKEAYSYPRRSLEKAGILKKKKTKTMFICSLSSAFAVLKLGSDNLVLRKTQTCFKLLRCTLSEKLTVAHRDFTQRKYQQCS